MAREINEKTKVTFALQAPDAREVRLAGSFTEWESSPMVLRKQKDGTWKKTVPLKPGTYEYRFMVDGQWMDDPNCSARRPNAFGTQNCVRVVTGG